MAKISTYPNASPVQLSDRLIGSDVGDGNATKNFLISDIIGLANLGQFVPYTGATGNVDLGTYGLTSSGLTTTTLSATGAANFTGLSTFSSSVNFNSSARFSSVVRDGVNSVGTNGQVLTSIATGVRWRSYGLQDVLLAGDSAITNMTLLGAAIFDTGYLNVRNSLKCVGILYDQTLNAGTADQVLTSQVTGVSWKTMNLQQILNTGSTAISPMTLTGILTADTIKSNTQLEVSGSFKDGLGSFGSSGQVLKSTGTQVQWVSESNALPNGMFYSNTDQTCVVGTPEAMKFENTVYSNGPYIVNDSFGTPNILLVTESGLYNVQFSAQFYKFTGGTARRAEIWFRNAGTDIPWSNRQTTLQDSTHYTTVSWNILVQLTAGQNFQIMWHQAGDIDLRAVPTQASPSRPASPSVMMTVFKVQ